MDKLEHLKDWKTKYSGHLKIELWDGVKIGLGRIGFRIEKPPRIKDIIELKKWNIAEIEKNIENEKLKKENLDKELILLEAKKNDKGDVPPIVDDAEKLKEEKTPEDPKDQR